MHPGLLLGVILRFSLGAAAFPWISPQTDAVKLGANVADRMDILPNVYSMALAELQELESEPLCHRNAARLLVHHCQLLEGKDESTVLTDSGRVARDFVDSYAASLAICDLERGSFRIPSACNKFRESTLAGLAVPLKPELHVTTPEIDKCLEGLAQSDSAWNTWVSYRHKALRFCEAARAENEKDHHIRLHQRVTNILSKLTTEVETHMKTRLGDLDNGFDRTTSKLVGLEPRLDVLAKGFNRLDDILSTRVLGAAENSQRMMNRAALDATSLQELLTIMVQEMGHQRDEFSASHETALQALNIKTYGQTEGIMTTLADAVSSSNSLRMDMAQSQSQAKEMVQRQQDLQEGMHMLETHVDKISSKIEAHDEKLHHAQHKAQQVLGTLDSIASSTTSFQSSLVNSVGFKGWWPYIYCPIASLVMGSYGLPPSAMRNIALVGLGELAGLAISNVADLVPDFTSGKVGEKTAMGSNVTTFSGNAGLSTDFFNNYDLRKI